MEAPDYRERIYGIFADPGEDLDAKIRRALDVGREFLDVSIGFVSGIDEGNQTIEYAVGDHPLIQYGETCPLDRAYCRRTVQLDSVLVVHDAEGSADVSDLAFETFGLGTYIGAKIIVNDETYGSVCFADQSERGRPFTEAESYFVELLARLVGHAFERAVYERELDERREIYRSVVDSSFDLVFRLGTDGEFTYLSSSVEPLLGEPPEAYLGRHFTAMLPTSETIGLAESLFERVLRGETVEEYEFPLNHAYGHRVWVDIRVSPVYDRDADVSESAGTPIIGAQGMVHDATSRRRRIQHIRVPNRVLRHNLRNDMNVISGYAEILSDRLTGEEAEFANRILETGADLVEVGETAR